MPVLVAVKRGCVAELKVPSLQHLARNWRSQPSLIERELVKVVLKPPIFSYSPLANVVRDLLVLKVPPDQVIEGIRRGVKQENTREDFVAIAELLSEHFGQIKPSFVQSVDRRLYPVGRGLYVPFEPPVFYGASGNLFFPWLSFWRSNPIADERLSLFTTVVDDLLLQDPDLERAKFEIFDFSFVKSEGARKLRITDAATVPRVSAARKAEMLDIFVSGYLAALKTLKSWPRAERPAADEREAEDPVQPSLL
jgi:hypothetical protein